MRVLMALVVMASAASAQQQDPRAQDFILNRMKDRLKLSEEQTAKVKEILAKDTEERTKMDDARTEKINALLDDTQKKEYEAMRAQFRGAAGGAGGGNRAFGLGGAGGGQGFRPGQLNLDDVKRELSLTDEQVEKIKPLYDEFNAGIQKRMDELREKGFQGLNIGEEMQKGMDAMKALAEKVKVHLTEEQKPKLDALMERATAFMRMIPNMMGNRAGGGAPAARLSVDERTRKAVDALKIEKEDERTAISELIAKVIKAQDDLEDWMKSARGTLSEAAKNRELSDAGVEDRIKDAQDERRKREKELAALQKQLVEVVSSRQELELMSQGILK